MPARPCPECRHPAPRFLAAPSQSADVSYYRCDDCGHVWHVPNTHPDAAPYPVTPARAVTA